MANWKTGAAGLSNTAFIVEAIPTATYNATTSATTKGLVPAAAPTDVSAGKFLRADGAWAIPSGTPVFSHQQMTASLQWTIAHNLGRYPAISVFSLGGQEIEADVINLSTNVAQVNFNLPVTGTAICV